MIEFSSQNAFELKDSANRRDWILSIVAGEGKSIHELQYVFCTDDFLHKLNVDFLSHDTLTDIITFDYTSGDIVAGEIYISIDRVVDNAKDLNVAFEDELDRVLIHGILHLCGYLDKSEDEKNLMRAKEDYCLERRGW
jgi:rRNA maturation RNase YbeY